MEILNLERKNEYTTYLINLLAPIFYDGIYSIYNESNNINTKDNELKIFQSLLKGIPEWDSKILDDEVNRIKICSKCDYLENLLKAIIKSNIIILMNEKNIDDELFNIDFKVFIHNCYITLAKAFYQYPDLFYHKIKSTDVKRNQRESINIIKDEIKNTIRKMIPLNIILEEYLINKPENVSIVNEDEKLQMSIKKMVNTEIEGGDKITLDGGNKNNDSNAKISIYQNDDLTESISYSTNAKSNTEKYSRSYTTSISNTSNISPRLVSEKQKSIVNNSIDTDKIINKLKNKNSEENLNVISSNHESEHVKTINNSDSIRTINNETSISYNDDNNYITVYNG